MKYWYFTILLFASCAGNNDAGSFFQISQLQLVPCNWVQKKNNSLCVLNNKFRPGRDSVRFVFSVTGLRFFDKDRKEISRDLPAAGNLGTLEQLTDIKLLIRNKLQPEFEDVSRHLLYTTDTSMLLFLNGEDSVLFGQLDKMDMQLQGAKTYDGFDVFIKEVNAGPQSVSNRDLIRSDHKPYVVFSVPQSFLAPGNNELMVTLYSGSDTVSAKTSLNLGE